MIYLNDLRSEFISSTNRGAFKEYISHPFDVENIDLFKAAVSQGYDDAKRTFSDISKFWTQHSKDAFFGFIANAIQDACQNPPEDFERWHRDLCKDTCNWLNTRGYNRSTFGQGQKIVNMAFKYLFCLKGAENYPIFQQCHMPLDSFTLEWYKRFVWKRKNTSTPTLTGDDKWSNLSEEKYAGIANAIATALKTAPEFVCNNQSVTLPEFPLFAEFYIWPEMQMHLSTEGFLFSFHKPNQAEKNDWKQKSVSAKLDTIKLCIDEYQQIHEKGSFAVK